MAGGEELWTIDTGPLNLSGLEEQAHRYFSAKYAAREQSLATCRLVIRNAGNAIRAAHRRELAQAHTLLETSRSAASQARVEAEAFPELAHAGYMHDALKELVEACLVVALVGGTPPPDRDELGVSWPAYLAGLAEAVGELRRFALDALRRGENATAEVMLTHMTNIYELLVTLDYPDAVTGSLRHATDGARAILERTRGDVTAALVQQRLELAIRASGLPHD